MTPEEEAAIEHAYAYQLEISCNLLIGACVNARRTGEDVQEAEKRFLLGVELARKVRDRMKALLG